MQQDGLQALAGNLVQVLGDAFHRHDALELLLDEALPLLVQLGPLGEGPCYASGHAPVDAVHLRSMLDCYVYGRCICRGETSGHTLDLMMPLNHSGHSGPLTPTKIGNPLFRSSCC